MTLDHLPPMLTFAEVAAVFRADVANADARRRTVLALIDRFDLPVFEVGPRRQLIPRWAVEQIIATGQPIACSAAPISVERPGAHVAACAPNIEDAS